MVIIANTKENYEKAVAEAARISYDICFSEMCEEEDKVPMPKLDFNCNHRVFGAEYNRNTNTISVPSYEAKMKVVPPGRALCQYSFLEEIGHETGHAFENILSGGRSKYDGKDLSSRQKWEEGVAIRLEEIVAKNFHKALKEEDIDEDKKIIDRFKENYSTIEKDIFKRSMFEKSPELLKYYAERGIELETKYSGRELSPIEKMKAAKNYLKLQKNTREGWLTLRKMPSSEFKKLLKDKEAFKKVKWKP